MKRYFRFRWNETTADKFDSWGFSIFYHEIGEDFYAIRQLIIYDNGNALKYTEEHLSDSYGILVETSLEEVIHNLEESGTIEISQEEFENVWVSNTALNE